MARQVTLEHAKQIVRKLKAKKSTVAGTSKAHKHYDFIEGGQIILSFSLRHGSEKDLGHDHLQAELNLNTHKTKCLAQCTYSRDQYLADLRTQGIFS